MRRSLPTILTALLVISCTSMSSMSSRPTLQVMQEYPSHRADVDIHNPRVVTPPVFYGWAYGWAEACTGIQGDYNRVTWAIASGLIDHNDPNMTYSGIWQYGDNTSLIIIQERFAFDLQTLTHEIIHDLTNGLPASGLMQRCTPNWQNLLLLSDSVPHGT